VTDLIPQLKIAQQNKQAWRLRFAVAENSAQIAKHMKKEHVDQYIIPIYTSLMNDSEPEVRSEAVNRIAELAEFCTSSNIV
jgi:HEAT repeat protein